MIYLYRGLEIPANGGPVNSEPEQTGNLPENALTNAPSAQLRNNGVTSNTGSNRAVTGPSNQRQQHGLRQQSIRSFNSAGNEQRNAQENRQFSCSNHETAHRNHRSTNDMNAVDESEYFEFEEVDENFDFDQLDQLEQEGQQIAESMDVWTDDFNAIPDDELVCEANFDQSDSNEMSSDVIREPSKPPKLKSSSQNASESRIVSDRNSMKNASGQCAAGRNANILDSSCFTVLKVKSEISSSPTAGDERLPRESNFNLGSKRPAIKQEASTKGM